MHTAGTDLMPADEPRIYGLIASMQEQVTQLSKEMHTRHAETVKEQRTVHDIVVAMSESMRNVARDVTEMKPHVEAYKLKAKDIDEAVVIAEDYKESQAEQRGAAKFRHALYGLWAGFAALLIFLLGKAWDALQAMGGKPPHPVVAVLLLIMSSQALAHDSWISRGGLRNGAGEWCCGEGDCFTVQPVELRADGYHLPGGEVVPLSEAQPSPDGQYWRCRRPDGTRRCFFAPPPNS